MKKQLKKMMRHEGFTLEIANKVDHSYKWDQVEKSIKNIETGKNVTSTNYREILGDKATIESIDRKEKVIAVFI